MRWNESEIFTMEKELARKYQKLLGKVRPRPIKIVDSNENFAMRASSKYLEANRKFLEKEPTKERHPLEKDGRMAGQPIR